MGKYWDEFKDRVGNKSVGVGMIIIDLVILLLLAGCMILADLGREWIFAHIGIGNLFTRITLVVVEILLDLSAVAVVGSWLWEEIKRIF
jgi:hypothetical protein